jgi:hypothetical protein
MKPLLSPTIAIMGVLLIAGRASAASAQNKTAAPALSQSKTAAGFWQETDSDGHVGGWFYFVERQGFFEGRLVKMFPKPGLPLIETCAKCPGDQKDAPMIGLTMVREMRRDGNKYEDGSILDPRDGTTYHAQMELSPDGQKLFVRGYLGIPLLGQTQVWTRLPDNTMGQKDIPNESHGPSTAPE